MDSNGKEFISTITNAPHSCFLLKRNSRPSSGHRPAAVPACGLHDGHALPDGTRCIMHVLLLHMKGWTDPSHNLTGKTINKRSPQPPPRTPTGCNLHSNFTVRSKHNQTCVDYCEQQGCAKPATQHMAHGYMQPENSKHAC
jgi:hypothetical protein